MHVLWHDDRAVAEHVFPRWIDRLFPDLEPHDHVRREVSETSDTRHARPATSLDLVTKEVCAACNNGWMADLEREAQPVLTPMILDQTTGLDLEQQRIVATWATKTMLTMQALNLGGWRIAGEEVYRWFCEHREPLPSSHAWIARYAGDREPASQWPISAHVYGFHLMRPGDPRPDDDAPTVGYTVAFPIGSFAVWIWGHTIHDGPAAVGGSDDRLLHIWPSEKPVRWPPSHSLDDDRALEAVTRRMPLGVPTLNNLGIDAA